MVENPFFQHWQNKNQQPPPPNPESTEKLSDFFEASLGEKMKAGKAGDKARDDRTMDGRLILTAYPMQEVQEDGTQKEIWYVP